MLEEAREGVRLDFGMIQLSHTEVRMITLVLTGRIQAEDLTALVYQALTSGFGLDAAMDHYLVHTATPDAPPQFFPPIISVVNLSYTFMGNYAVDMLCEGIRLEK